MLRARTWTILILKGISRTTRHVRDEGPGSSTLTRMTACLHAISSLRLLRPDKFLPHEATAPHDGSRVRARLFQPCDCELAMKHSGLLACAVHQVARKCPAGKTPGEAIITSLAIAYYPLGIRSLFFPPSIAASVKHIRVVVTAICEPVAASLHTFCSVPTPHHTCICTAQSAPEQDFTRPALLIRLPTFIAPFHRCTLLQAGLAAVPSFLACNQHHTLSPWRRE